MNKVIARNSLKGLLVLVMVVALVFAMSLSVSADTDVEGVAEDTLPAAIDQSVSEDLQANEANGDLAETERTRKMKIDVAKVWDGTPADSVTFKLWKKKCLKRSKAYSSKNKPLIYITDS